VEPIGNWYWIVAKLETARCVPKLMQARGATAGLDRPQRVTPA
jgi:hypothetical protein